MIKYSTFLDDYRAFIGALPGTVNLPQGWFQNWRGWDMWMCLRAGIGKRVLDTGALHTFGCLYWSEHGAVVTATDSYYWANRAPYAGLMTPYEWECVVERTSKGRVKAQQDDVQRMSFADDSFDTVLSISTIEHVQDDRAALSEMVRVGENVLITTEYNARGGKPYGESDGSYYRVYDEQTLSDLLDGFTVVNLVIDEPREPFTTAFIHVAKGDR